MKTGVNAIDKAIAARAVTEEVLVSVRQIIQSVDLHSRDLVRKFGLTVPQLVTLQTVSRGKSLTVGAIAKNVSLSQATVTGILDRLYKHGLIFRNRSEVDRRRVLIEPTKACEELLAKAPPLMQELFVDQFGKLDDWEQMMILSSLKRLVSLMNVKPSVSSAPFLATGEISEAVLK
ncbi:MAG: MarR family transcriptional regulator [Thermodesulfobacteriota bacterium]|nr:MarR family transcriptional regulator [Thermodesulfobacteriota bacterium]